MPVHKEMCICMYVYIMYMHVMYMYAHMYIVPQQWQSCSALKSGRRKVPSSNPGTLDQAVWNLPTKYVIKVDRICIYKGKKE